MKIHQVEYAGTVAKADGPRPGDLPQVAFSGRSNVGKSSLINMLLQRTRAKIAHVSGRPGKTQALNFYRVNGAFFLVDLPGFGYAKAPPKVREGWRSLIEGYLSREARLKGVVHLIDARRGPLETDLQMLDYLSSLGTPVLVVLTKIDKLKRAEREATLTKTIAGLGIEREQVLAFSSRTGEGRETLLAALGILLGEESDGEDAEAAEALDHDEGAEAREA